MNIIIIIKFLLFIYVVRCVCVYAAEHNVMYCKVSIDCHIKHTNTEC